MPTPADLPDPAFYPPWHARLRASYTRSQAVQNRVYERFMTACHARDAARCEAQAEEERAAARAVHAAEMREFRARGRGAPAAHPR